MTTDGDTKRALWALQERDDPNPGLSLDRVRRSEFANFLRRAADEIDAGLLSEALETPEQTRERIERRAPWGVSQKFRDQ